VKAGLYFLFPVADVLLVPVIVAAGAFAPGNDHDEPSLFARGWLIFISPPASLAARRSQRIFVFDPAESCGIKRKSPPAMGALSSVVAELGFLCDRHLPIGQE
jgi:hypothetical protein